MPRSKTARKKDVGTTAKLPPTSNPLNVKSVYSNNMHLTTSSIDARLLFNEILAEGGPVTVERRANIVMSIQHLKAMSQVLNEQIKTIDEREAARREQPPTQK